LKSPSKNRFTVTSSKSDFSQKMQKEVKRNMKSKIVAAILLSLMVFLLFAGVNAETFTSSGSFNETFNSPFLANWDAVELLPDYADIIQRYYAASNQYVLGFDMKPYNGWNVAYIVSKKSYPIVESTNFTVFMDQDQTYGDHTNFEEQWIYICPTHETDHDPYTEPDYLRIVWVKKDNWACIDRKVRGTSTREWQSGGINSPAGTWKISFFCQNTQLTHIIVYFGGVEKWSYTADWTTLAFDSAFVYLGVSQNTNYRNLYLFDNCWVDYSLQKSFYETFDNSASWTFGQHGQGTTTRSFSNKKMRLELVGTYADQWYEGYYGYNLGSSFPDPWGFTSGGAERTEGGLMVECTFYQLNSPGEQWFVFGNFYTTGLDPSYPENPTGSGKLYFDVDVCSKSSYSCFIVAWYGSKGGSATDVWRDKFWESTNPVYLQGTYRIYVWKNPNWCWELYFRSLSGSSWELLNHHDYDTNAWNFLRNINGQSTAVYVGGSEYGNQGSGKLRVFDNLAIQWGFVPAA
jgi:hypothetical protein